MVDTAGVQRRGRGRPSGSNGSDTRNKILRAAREVFSEVGYDAATFKDIAARADITRTSVNHYFHSKEELYETLFDSTRERIDSVVRTGLRKADAENGVVERISTFLHAAVNIDSADRSVAKFIVASLFDSFRNPEFGSRALGQLDEVRAFFLSTLESDVVRGTLRSDADLTAITEMLVAVMWGMSMYAGFVGTNDQLESVVDQFVELLAGRLFEGPSAETEPRLS
ncbi:TetR family transcriptional regulator [Nocardia sp. ET3-3]|uniref:TetR family transcriptional regulator n=1 Tax=Nocardia terrae TaxID=2675851 RepID=A0A7K1V263_9NOCA|nr:TetR/AcrR family transcriptional regulator [Nocardia terrae]MVU80695.1 TetR family transcriptional regulator [Nocardia terrae]